MKDLAGTWKLVNVESRDPEGKPLASQYGPLPVGRIVFTREGRVLVGVTDGRPSLPPGTKREYGGYTGAFTFSGTTLTTQVDASPNPALVGTAQVRGVRFEGERMVLHPPPREIGGVLHDRELTWERISTD
ncbi:MAG: lipocalin-like domain-containing protein [Alphaproteobacteria bacterium]|nr:lipocalin-like domain-containing protein [Alphaproteobacteria bacterium]